MKIIFFFLSCHAIRTFLIFRSDTSIFVHFCAKVKCFCSLLCKFSFSLLLFVVHLFSFSVHFVHKQIFLFFVRFSSPQNIGIPEYNFRNVMQIAFFADASPGCFVLHKPAFQPARKCCAGCLIFFSFQRLMASIVSSSTGTIGRQDSSSFPAVFFSSFFSAAIVS